MVGGVEAGLSVDPLVELTAIVAIPAELGFYGGVAVCFGGGARGDHDLLG